ncbi:Zinc-finger homeodomain protein 2 [Hibiscus syriacus]|uniref:Zinc-finger homeodomain protein 2 n=1 Tax=Hibiscus syriacus TaxID=106335 RepID=A0A6A2XX70_HIBSY|nr:zinc-finger homeodomain protein 2-like [Hibiscus syriacus]KAE8666776.1 Zinc-finger homeodomain protein 2 [Hibiscus syriacus]
MDFEEQEEQEEEMGVAVPLPPGYDSLGNSSAARSKIGPLSGPEGGAASATPRKVGSGIRYRECLKNHALSIGGHAVDGCGEFIAAGDEGTLDALKCAACNCHRNFHRKETEGEGSNIYIPPHHHHHHHQHQHLQFSPYYWAPPPAGYLHLTRTPQKRSLALPAATGGGIAGAYSREDEDVSNPSSSGGGGGGEGSGGLKKRLRTRFTPEQKDKMLGFAERLGWRIQKHDEAAVEQFCEETGVKRQVLKIWMHNNKYTLGKKP